MCWILTKNAFKRAEEVLEEIRKEEETLKERVVDENFGNCCADSRKKVWDLMEKPQSSKGARVSWEKNRYCYRLILYLDDGSITNYENLARYAYGFILKF